MRTMSFKINFRFLTSVINGRMCATKVIDKLEEGVPRHELCFKGSIFLLFGMNFHSRNEDIGGIKG